MQTAPKQNSIETEPLDNETGRLEFSKPIALDSSILHPNYIDGDGEPLSTEEAVSQYFYKRKGERESIKSNNTVERGLQWRDEKNYAWSLDLDRQLADKYDNLSTVLISLRVQRDVKSRVTLLDELRRAFDDMLRNKLEYALDTSVESWEWVAIFAGTEQYATPHVHLYLLIDGDVGIGLFRPAVERFARKCEYAPSNCRGNRVTDGTVRIMGVESDDAIPRRSRDGVSAGMLYVSQQLAHLPDYKNLERDEAIWGSAVRAWNGGCHFRSSEYDVWDDGKTESGRFDFSIKQQCKSKVDFTFKDYASEICGDKFDISRYDITG